MGVKNLIKVLSQLYPEAFSERSVETLAGMRIAVDASIVIYQNQTAIMGKMEGLLNDHNEDITHLVGMLNKLLFFRRHAVRPVFVFDGKPPEEKQEILQKRSASRSKAEADIKDAAADRQGTLRQRGVRISDTITQEIIHLFHLLDIPYVMAEGEADPVCVALQDQGAVDMILSDDSDLFLYGARRVVRKLSSKNQAYQLVDLPESVSIESLVAAGVTLGCDYFPGIKGIGKTRTMEAMKHGVIVDLVKSTGHTKEYEMLLGIFRPSKKIEYTIQRGKTSSYTQAQAEAFLRDKMSLDKARIQRVIGMFFPPVWS